MKARRFVLLRIIALRISILVALVPNAWSANREKKSTIRFWHSMSGSLEQKLQAIIAKYHESQDSIQINATYKGNYTDSLNAVVAAYRGSKQPHITQVFEVGTASMMYSGAVLPVEDLFNRFSVSLPKADFLPPVAGYYSNLDGKLISLPFNSSTPILYYNKDILDSLQMTKIPETWEEMFEVSRQIKSKSPYCGLVFAWQSWTLVENFSAINDLPIAVPDNGFRGLDVTMNLMNPALQSTIAKVAAAVQKKEFLFEGRRSEAPRRAFVARKCAFLVDSSASVSFLKKSAQFKWGSAFQPYLAGKRPQNSLIGGASLWVLKGHPEEDYPKAVDFLKFLTRPEIQAEWHQATGYIPITYSAYKVSTEQGYYLKEPDQETAVRQLLRGPISANSRGIRLGNFSQVREVIEENLEKIWEGRVDARTGLKHADERANFVLKRFANLRGKQGGGAGVVR